MYVLRSGNAFSNVDIWYVKDDQPDDIFMKIEDAINEVNTDKIQVLSESEVGAYFLNYCS